MPSIREISHKHIAAMIAGNACLRIAGGAAGILVGLFMAALHDRGTHVSTLLVGALGAASYAAEFLSSVPLGAASDALSPRIVITAGALIAAGGVQLFVASTEAIVLFASQVLEGLGAAAVTPSLLAHLTDLTGQDRTLRTKVMSYFELSLLVGLAVGGIMGAQFWSLLHNAAFSSVALLYVIAAILLFLGTVRSRSQGLPYSLSSFLHALRQPSLRRLAPAWLAVYAMVGLWLGPTVTFLLTRRPETDQYLDGLLHGRPADMGWILLAFSIFFGAGVTGWSFLLSRMPEQRAFQITLSSLIAASAGLFALNHLGRDSVVLRWLLIALTVACLMVESGFTPAALSFLSGSLKGIRGRGAAMGLYSLLFSGGAIGGSLLAASLGAWFAVDGLIYGTAGLAILALILVRRV